MYSTGHRSKKRSKSDGLEVVDASGARPRLGPGTRGPTTRRGPTGSGGPGGATRGPDDSGTRGSGPGAGGSDGSAAWSNHHWSWTHAVPPFDGPAVVPVYFGSPYMTHASDKLLTDQLRLMAEHFPGECAYLDVTTGRRITFQEWDRDSDRLAAALLDAGVAKGDRVAIYLPPEEVLEWIAAYAAAHKAGAVAVPTNTRLARPRAGVRAPPLRSGGGLRRCRHHLDPRGGPPRPAGVALGGHDGRGLSARLDRVGRPPAG